MKIALLALALGLSLPLTLGGDPLLSKKDSEVAFQAGIAALSTTPSKADSIDSIRKTLLPFEVLKGNFQQVKTIKILKLPLKSSGSFTLARGKGLIWHPAKPISSMLLINRDDIAGIQDGKKQVFVSMKEQPALSVIGKILFAVFAADLDELQKHFSFIAPSCNLGRWELTLKPKDPSVAKVVSEINIYGGQTVHGLTLFEANSDSTKIEFLDVTEKQPLTKAEEALFE